MILLYGFLLLGLIIFIHELGHFVVGKLIGIRFATFSIGLGPRVFKRKIGDTVYCLSVLPIGGYVRSNAHKEGAGGREVVAWLEAIGKFLTPLSAEEAELSRIHKAQGQEVSSKKPILFMFYLLGGCLFNLLGAFLILSTYYFTSQTIDTYPSNTRIGDIPKEGLLYNKGLRANDEVIKVNGWKTWNWMAVNKAMEKSNAPESAIVVRRGEETIEFSIPNKVNLEDIGANSFYDYYKNLFKYEIKTQSMGVYDSAFYTVRYIRRHFFDIPKDLLGIHEDRRKPVNKSVQSKDSNELLGFTRGVMEIGHVASETWEMTVTVIMLISFGAIMINLLPIPGTDGLQLVLHMIEKIFRIDITYQKKVFISYSGLALMLALTIVLTFRDAYRAWFA